MRSYVSYSSGSISGTSVVEDLYDRITREITRHTSNGFQSWELYQEIASTSGSIDRVYRSRGDRSIASSSGDTNLFIRVLQVSSSQIRFGAYQDWSPASSTSTGSLNLNPGGARPSSFTANTWLNLSSSLTSSWWSFVNEYAFGMLVRQHTGSLGWKGVFMENPSYETMVGFNGRARIITTTTASGDITIELDRNLSGTWTQQNVIQPNQGITLVNQTTDGQPLTASNTETAIVRSVFGNKVNLAGVRYLYNSGSLFGILPNAMIVTTVTTSMNVSSYTTTLPDGYYNNGVEALAGYYLSNVQLGIGGVHIQESEEDPDRYLRFYAERQVFQHYFPSPTNAGLIGHSNFIHLCASGSGVTAGNYATGSSDMTYVLFNSQSQGGQGGFQLMMGPIAEGTASIDPGNKVFGVYVPFERSTTGSIIYGMPIVSAARVETITLDANHGIFYQRAFDSGTGAFVYWTSIGAPDPSPVVTQPQYTGVLSLYTIVARLDN